MSEVSLVLERVARGDGDAARELLPLVYAELRRLARARLARAAPGATLQPTALVHEAYVELVGKGDPGWNGRAHFFGAAARAMHDIVVDRARRKAAQKRGGGVTPDNVDELEMTIAAPNDAPIEDALALSRALEKLRAEHPERAEVAMLKTFVGMSEEEIAEVQGVSARTIERHWRFARAWLARELEA